MARLRSDLTRLRGNKAWTLGRKDGDGNRSLMCECGEAEETVEHFLMSCVRWTSQRRLRDLRVHNMFHPGEPEPDPHMSLPMLLHCPPTTRKTLRVEKVVCEFIIQTKGRPVEGPQMWTRGTPGGTEEATAKLSR